MKSRLMIPGIAMLILFANCKNDSHANQENSHKDTIEMTESDEKDTEEKAILLNEGEKWEVNKEMLPHIEKSEAVFDNFEGDDYTALSEEMMKHTNNLIQSCTMEGPSHDELHKWLHPHIELINELKQERKGEEAYEDMAVSFEIFHEYFK